MAVTRSFKSVPDIAPEADELACHREQARIEDYRERIAEELALEWGLALAEAEGIARAARPRAGSPSPDAGNHNVIA